MSRKLELNPIYSILLKNHLIVAICLFIDAFLIRFAFLISSDNIFGQAPMLNIMTSLHVLTDQALLNNVYYQQLPFFLYSIAGAVKLGSEQILSPRFLVALISSLSLIPYYYLVKKVFNSKIALFSGLLLYSYYMHIIVSIISMPDAICIGFLFFCLWMLFIDKYLISAIFCLIACGYSYLGWILVPVLFSSIFLKKHKTLKQNLFNGILFLSIACLLPLIWTQVIENNYGQAWLWYKNFHNPDSVYTFLFLAGRSMQGILSDLFLKPGSIIFCLSFIGVIFAPNKKERYPYIFCITATILILSVHVFRKEILIVDQGILFIWALLIPYLIFGLFFVLRKLRLNHKVYGLIIVSIICSVSLVTGFFQRPKIPQSVTEVSWWLQENADANSLIYLQKQDKGYHSAIVMQSKLPQKNFSFLEDNNLQNIAHMDKKQYLILPVSEVEYMDLEQWESKDKLKEYLIFMKNKEGSRTQRH
ncbi:MAG: glycosyltransferase family 39 protein [Candidatus Omnitrophica bacterium]|nr:glycosyltransferase family 39 protein [Candidatus Omnitrophota bacterium]